MAELNTGDSFAGRHNGPRPDEVTEMLEVLGLSSLDDLVKATVPPSILKPGGYEAPAMTEATVILPENRPPPRKSLNPPYFTKAV